MRPFFFLQVTTKSTLQKTRHVSRDLIYPQTVFFFEITHPISNPIAPNAQSDCAGFWVPGTPMSQLGCVVERCRNLRSQGIRGHTKIGSMYPNFVPRKTFQKTNWMGFLWFSIYKNSIFYVTKQHRKLFTKDHPNLARASPSWVTKHLRILFLHVLKGPG